MLNRVKQFRGNFPTVHLVAVSACVLILGLTLLLLPSQEVGANRGDLPSPLTVIKTVDTPDPKTVTTIPSQTITTAPVEPNWISYIIGDGDNLTSMFKKAGLTPRDVYHVAAAGKETKAFTRLFPGQTLSFEIKNGKLSKLKHTESKLKHTILYTDNNGSYQINSVIRTPEKRQQFTSGTIKDSLFLAGAEAGLSSKKIMELASIFGWDVDFVLDIRKNDDFSLIYEEHYLDGEKIGEGPIIAAQFTNRGNKFTALRYTNTQGDSSYYTPEGYSMRKAFLRSPVDFARISSRFSLSRKHPVLNRIRAHKGVDYAARTGTPIKAAGEGKITFRGRKGGFGNVVIVQHGSNITTLYAHMSNFKRGQRVGTRVKQGQVIGFVGQTGLASGPHLHYEFRVNGVHKNPLTVKLPQASPVAKAERSNFTETASSLLAQLETHQATTLAQSSR
ncbi:peptidoglycan DD-metalloendopeptidase family protein [Neptuniibacter sp. QD72_48]|uniref:peptidoglycan DD-metalloendopeptidase family protein n=1 Tax=unclassified Neptuniibacter TaxID=2630693 RepID=UPI0039F57FC8